MSLRALLRKELSWSKHNVAALVVLLLLVPGTAAYTSVAFQSVIPQDAPVAVTPANDEVTENELEVVDAAASLFADPVRYDSEQRAMDDLKRESVYAVVSVPPDLDDPESDATSGRSNGHRRPTPGPGSESAPARSTTAPRRPGPRCSGRRAP